MYLAVDKWRKPIAKAAGRFKPVATGGVHKVVLMMDSATATSKWMSLGVPTSLNHTSVKGQKYATMADEMAFPTALPVMTSWIPGKCLSFPDMFTTYRARTHRSQLVKTEAHAQTTIVRQLRMLEN